VRQHGEAEQRRGRSSMISVCVHERDQHCGYRLEGLRGRKRPARRDPRGDGRMQHRVRKVMLAGMLGFLTSDEAGRRWLGTEGVDGVVSCKHGVWRGHDSV
jgi:hypothetical protein